MARTFSSLQIRVSNFVVRHQTWILGAFALLSLCIYLAAGYFTNNKMGFPLDDSWIHQTYARNLAARGEWAFEPGHPSAGATSPLWVGLLAVGHLLGIPYFVWTFGLGYLILWSLALIAAYVCRRWFPDRLHLSLVAGLFFIFEWHLVWAAGSGMETLLFAIMCIGLFAWLLGHGTQGSTISFWFVSGLIVGLSVWVRPEGLTLLGPVALFLFARLANQRKSLESIALPVGFLIMFLPYLAFNLSISGSLWPNTFYAKQAEAVIYLTHPFWVRLEQVIFQPLIGTGLLLLPGLFYLIYASLIKRNWLPVIWAIWILGYMVLLAERLPLPFQHGRYAMPVMPSYFLLGLLGSVSWLQTRAIAKWKRYVSLAWTQGIAILLILMYAVAAPVYARDVAFIETEMVTIAQWLHANTPPDALIASHDIGAIGFFSERRVLDLAGLVTPEVIPFIHDEDRLAEYLDAEGADYLVSFLDWYPQLIQRSELVFQTHGKIAPALGGENMAVYRWLLDSE